MFLQALARPPVAYRQVAHNGSGTIESWHYVCLDAGKCVWMLAKVATLDLPMQQQEAACPLARGRIWSLLQLATHQFMSGTHIFMITCQCAVVATHCTAFACLMCKMCFRLCTPCDAVSGMLYFVLLLFAAIHISLLSECHRVCLQCG